MSKPSRRHFIRQLLGLLAIGGLPATIVAAPFTEEAGEEKLLMVNGWVVLESDLR